MRHQFALVIGEDLFEFGRQKQTDMIQLLFVRGGIVHQSSCFRVVFHMIRRGLVIFGNQRRHKSGKLLKSRLTNSARR
jgi:hypothetical protein